MSPWWPQASHLRLGEGERECEHVFARGGNLAATDLRTWSNATGDALALGIRSPVGCKVRGDWQDELRFAGGFGQDMRED